MKRLRALILITLLVMTACTRSSPPEEEKGNVDSPVAIKFRSSLQGMTRATYKTDLSNLASFKVAALTNATTPEVFFPPMEVTQQTDGTWQNSITYYWPSELLQFFAYAPSDLPFVINSQTQQLSGFTVAGKADEQKDVITAWSHGVRASFPATTDTVSLVFRHALALIEIYASNPSDFKVDILGVKICRIPATGTLTMQKSIEDFPVWSVENDSEKDFFIKGDKNATDATAIVTMQNSPKIRKIMFGQDGWLMLPQTLSPWTGGPVANGAYLSVLCQIHDANGVQVFPDEEGKYGFSSVPIHSKWESGHRYVYTLNFFDDGGSAGVIDPNPTSPDDPIGEDPDIDTSPGGNRPGGDVVINSPFTFTVEISDWINTDTDNTIIGF